jgi:hypothetical protein
MMDHGGVVGQAEFSFDLGLSTGQFAGSTFCQGGKFGAGRAATEGFKHDLLRFSESFEGRARFT